MISEDLWNETYFNDNIFSLCWLKNVFEETVNIINYIKSQSLNTYLFNSLQVKMANTHEGYLSMVVFEQCTFLWSFEFQAELATFFFRGAPFLLERTINRKTVAIQTWGLVTHFLKNEWSELVNSKKIVFAAKDGFKLLG